MKKVGRKHVRDAGKVIISCAVTGSIHTPSMSPHLPITAEEITEQSVGAAEAGAAIIHLHARDPADGRPSGDPALFMQFLPRIKQRSGAVLNITTGHGPGMTVEERLAAAVLAKPELASLNMGSFNAGVMPIKDEAAFTHDWEVPYLRGFEDGIGSNSFSTIKRFITEVGAGGTRFEFECYDIGHLYAIAHFSNAGLIKPPFFIQCIFGVMGGIGPDAANLTYMINTAEKLFGNDYYLSVLAAGKHQMRFVTMSAIMGGNVRVGLEDSLFLGRGQLARSNAEQVAKIRRILEELSFEVASPDEARDMLDLKGGDQVAF
jgi:uncharacterized protein (DUF849 family)